MLTAQDLCIVKIRPTLFRQGYDMTEVDNLIEEVIATINELTAENDRLEAELAKLKYNALN